MYILLYPTSYLGTINLTQYIFVFRSNNIASKDVYHKTILVKSESLKDDFGEQGEICKHNQS